MSSPSTADHCKSIYESVFILFGDFLLVTFPPTIWVLILSLIWSKKPFHITQISIQYKLTEDLD